MAGAVTRLKRRSEFLRVARGGRKWALPGLVLQMVRRDAGGGEPDGGAVIGVGLTVSRKVGNAVVRNRVRRRLRAAAEEVLPVHAKPGCDYVIIGRVATLRRPYGALLADLVEALKRVGAFREPPKPGGDVGSGRTTS